MQCHLKREGSGAHAFLVAAGADVLAFGMGAETRFGGIVSTNTSAEAFRYAMEMVRCGANPADASQNVYQSRSEASFALEAVMLSRLFKDPSGRWAISFVTRDDMERTGAVKSDTETLIDTVRSMAGIQVACILREQEGEVRGSLRAKGDDVDVF